jgi:hypothetical protein
LLRIRCFLATLASAAPPALAFGEPMLIHPPAPAAAAVTAPLKSDGELRYALGAGGNYASGTTATLTSANVGGEGVVADTETRLRFGAKALWSRTVGETASAETTPLLLTEETQHRWGPAPGSGRSSRSFQQCAPARRRTACSTPASRSR